MLVSADIAYASDFSISNVGCSMCAVTDMLAQHKQQEEDNGDEFVVWNVDGTFFVRPNYAKILKLLSL